MLLIFLILNWGYEVKNWGRISHGSVAGLGFVLSDVGPAHLQNEVRLEVVLHQGLISEPNLELEAQSYGNGFKASGLAEFEMVFCKDGLDPTSVFVVRFGSIFGTWCIE